MSKILLKLLAHSPTDNTKVLKKAIVEGCEYGLGQLESARSEPLILCSSPLKSSSEFAIDASGIILFTPENFGYMSGALKDWFDRSFYNLENQTRGLPYILLVRAGKDGTGAIRSIQSIAKGLGWKQVLEPMIIKGDINSKTIESVEEYAATFAAGLCLGVY